MGIPALVALLSNGVAMGAAMTAVYGIGGSILLRLGAMALLNAISKPRGKSQGGITFAETNSVPEGVIVYGRTRISGAWVARKTVAAGGKPNQHFHMVLTLACHQIDAVEAVYLERELVWSLAKFEADAAAGTGDPNLWGLTESPFRDHLIVRPYLGTADQLAEPLFVAVGGSDWTATARLQGVAYLYLRLDYDDVFASGLPNPSAVIRGKPVRDPRTGLTAWTQNPALHWRDYLLTPKRQGGCGAQLREVPDEAVIALANICDEEVALAGGGTEPRYQFNGWLATGDTPATNLDHIARQWGGWWTYFAGVFVAGGAAYQPPAAHVDADWMAGPMRVTGKRPMEEQFNAVKGIYVDAAAWWVQTDLPQISSTSWMIEDGGERSVLDLGELRGEVRIAGGQRLLKLALLNRRRQTSVDLECNLRAAGLQLGDTVTLENPLRGWTDKEFEVRGIGYAIRQDAGGMRPVVLLRLLETSPAVFDWTTSEEKPRPAGPGGALVSPWARPAVGAPAMSETLYSTRTGGVKTSVTLRALTDNPFVEAWEFSMRAEAEAPEDARIIPATTPEVRVDDLLPGAYVLGVRARTSRGIWSEWNYSGALEVFGLALPPQALAGLAAAVNSGLITLRWDQAADLDVRGGGTIEIRHSFMPDATWQTSTTFGKAVPGSSTLVTGPALSGTYLISARDSQGVRGPVTAINTSAPDVVPMTVLAALTEHPAFTGAKTGCTVEGSALALDEGMTSASYDFHDLMDLGAVTTVRMTARISVLISERDGLFDGPDLFDSAALFDGSEEAEGDVTVWVSATEDDPGGSPVWGAWQVFDRTEVSGRGFRFRADIAAASDSYRVAITTLEIVAEERA
mgnify:CR=1 FL=1